MQELKHNLLQAYSEANLNKITAKILELYKHKQQNGLKQFCKVVNDFVDFPYETSSRLYAKLIMLYHPDKVNDFHEKINLAADQEQLESLGHIQPILKLVQKEGSYESDLKTPEEFEKEYGWNYQPMDADYFVAREEDETVNYLFDEENPAENYYFAQDEQLPDGSFLAGLKRKIYGARHVEFPTYLLEDMEEIEMAEYEIEQLDGIEFCTHVKVMDLSYNQLFDVTQLEHCVFVQELYLANNQIHYIDPVYHMPDLRVLDVSNNSIEDISALFHLKCLEYVNLLGNPVSKNQVDKLKQLGVVVVT